MAVVAPGAHDAGDFEAALELLGHRVVVQAPGAWEPGDVATGRSPDVVLVTIGDDLDEALSAIDVIVAESASPVVAVGRQADPALADVMATHGVFGYAGAADPEQLQAAIEVARVRFADYRNLQAAFDRRALVEQAKGILMERHSIDERAAFEMLRAHARRTNRKLVGVAAAVIEGHRLLPGG